MDTCDLQIDHASVSQSHATLKLSDNAIYLNDSNSRFGTLIEMSSELELAPNKAYTIQAKGTVLTFIVREAKLTYEDKLEESIKYRQKHTKERYIS